MKALLATTCFLLTALTAYPQLFNKAEIESVDRQYETALKSGNLTALFQIIASDCLFYGTDPTDRWTASDFRKVVEQNAARKTLNLTTISRDIMPLSGGKAAVVTKQINWPIFKTPLSEVIVYEKSNGWKMKSWHLSVLLPDKQRLKLNQMLAK
ncbi:hypothetical protein GCM10028805_55200 [Spirosoma harenae]